MSVIYLDKKKKIGRGKKIGKKIFFLQILWWLCTTVASSVDTAYNSLKICIYFGTYLYVWTPDLNTTFDIAVSTNNK